MVAYDNTAVLPLKITGETNVPPGKKISGLLIYLPPPNENSTNKTDGKDIPFDKWNMPAQPTGYIKSNLYDFF